ncbi:hypothetical protein [Neorhizobium vignae]|uniref:hypothetical protein n=1 Tax=Neorhizobium vignae TaxID=690585 RepID=UPI00056B5557|nr:hypothetical protein [Neorhizobium vignae]
MRDNLIVKLRADGETIPTIAKQLGLPTTTIKVVLQNHAYCIVDTPPPAGMSIRTACLIWRSLGSWPTSANAGELSLRKQAFMRAPGTKRKDWRDFDAWVARSRHPDPTQPAITHVEESDEVFLQVVSLSQGV